MSGSPVQTPDVNAAQRNATRAERIVQWLKGPDAAGWLIFVLILASVVTTKFEIAFGTRDPHVDGALYTNVAANVRDGNGLSSHFSWYHQGYPRFPHPTSLYPLWPLVYGTVGKFFPLIQGGVWCNTVLYYVTLVFTYVWANRAFTGSALPSLMSSNSTHPANVALQRVVAAIRPGHIVVVVFGFHERYFQFTSMPYTEGVGYLLVMVSLWWGQRTLPKPTGKSSFVLGLLLGLTFLTRYQLAITVIAILMAYAWQFVAGSNRRNTLIAVVATVAGMVVTIAPFFYYCSTFLHDGIGSIFPFRKGRITDVLTIQNMKMKGDGFWNTALDRLSGFNVAFSKGKWGFLPIYGWGIYAVPIAGVYLAYLAVKGKASNGLAWLKDPKSLPYIFVVLFALGGFFHLFLIHKSFSHPWYFSRRQGVPSAFLVALAIVLLCRSRYRLIALMGLFLFGSTAVHQWQYIQERKVQYLKAKRDRIFPKATKGNWTSIHDEVASWLNQERKRRDKLTVIHRAPWLYVTRTDDVGFHWQSSASKLKDIVAMCDKLGADLVFVGKADKKRGWYKHKKFHKYFKPYKNRRVGGLEIYERRASSDPDSPVIEQDKRRRENETNEQRKARHKQERGQRKEKREERKRKREAKREKKVKFDAEAQETEATHDTQPKSVH